VLHPVFDLQEYTAPLLSWRKPLLTDRDIRLPIYLGCRIGFPNPSPADLHTRIRLCDLIPVHYSYRLLLEPSAARFQVSSLDSPRPPFLLVDRSQLAFSERGRYYPRQSSEATTTPCLRAMMAHCSHSDSDEFAWMVPSTLPFMYSSCPEPRIR